MSWAKTKLPFTSLEFISKSDHGLFKHKRKPIKVITLEFDLWREKNDQWSSARNWNISCPDLGQDQASSLNGGLVFIVNSKEFANNCFLHQSPSLQIFLPGIQNEKTFFVPIASLALSGPFCSPFAALSRPFTAFSWPFVALLLLFYGPFAAFFGLFTTLSRPFCSLFASLALPFSKRRRETGTSFFGKVLWTCSTKAFLMQQGAAAVV